MPGVGLDGAGVWNREEKHSRRREISLQARGICTEPALPKKSSQLSLTLYFCRELIKHGISFSPHLSWLHPDSPAKAVWTLTIPR